MFSLGSWEGGGAGLDGHLIFCLLYIPLRDTFASGFFLRGVFLVANRIYSVLSGQGNHHIRFSGD
jgi:hypothetical protein